jgi:D-alanine-D-alanine ligase
LLKQLNVALVYNAKPEETNEDSGEDDKRGDDNGATVTVASRTKIKKTNADTYAEWDSFDTILAVKAALETQHRVTLIEANEEAYPKLLTLQPEIVFNIAEGIRGASREAQIPAMMEMLGIPFTGSDALTLGICLDKSRAKEILTYHHIPTPEFAVVNSLEELTRCSVGLPAIVKPLHEGSSKGVLDSSVVRTNDELVVQVKRVLTEYQEPALVEKYLSGREFTVAMIGNGKAVRVLPIVELRFDLLPKGANPIYSYEAKWKWDTLEHPLGEMYTCPADISPELEKNIKVACTEAFQILRCRDWCRIDIRLDDQGTPNIIELNPLPGILPNPDDHSSFPMAARKGGMNYVQLLTGVLHEAAKRHHLL